MNSHSQSDWKSLLAQLNFYNKWNEQILEDINYPLPDPAWDYYMKACSLHRAIALVLQALNFMKDCEIANPESDRVARAFIDNAIATLQQALPPEEPT